MFEVRITIGDLFSLLIQPFAFLLFLACHGSAVLLVNRRALSTNFDNLVHRIRTVSHVAATAGFGQVVGSVHSLHRAYGAPCGDAGANPSGIWAGFNQIFCGYEISLANHR